MINMYVKNYLVETNYNIMLKYIYDQINLEVESNWIKKTIWIWIIKLKILL